MDDATSVTLGYNTGCVVTRAGGAKCWGRNLNGEVGNGANTNAGSPVSVTGLTTNVVSVRAGWSFACALTTAGAIHCWGSNEYGKLGAPLVQGSSRTPVIVPGLESNVIAFDLGPHNACVVRTGGTVSCWGRGSEGILARSNNRDAPSPVDIAGIPGAARSVTVGTDHACALLETGSLHCWGANDYGALGIASVSTPVASVSSASEFSCALTTRGVVKCAGRGSVGELGDGQKMASSSPVFVSGL